MNKDSKTTVLSIEEQELITGAVFLLINECPLIPKEIALKYQDITGNAIGLFPSHGAVYLKKFITGGFLAQTPFSLRYRSSPTTNSARLDRENLLGKIAEWLGRGEVKEGPEIYQLEAYPPLTDGRTIVSIERTSTTFLAEMQEDGTADYQCYLNLVYRKER